MTKTQIERQWIRWACRVFSTREEEKLWLEMCGRRTISYLHKNELVMFYDIIMGH